MKNALTEMLEDVNWNPLSQENRNQWQWVDGLERVAEELVLDRDESTDECTRLIRYLPNSTTTKTGDIICSSPVDLLILRGRLYDESTNQWLEQGEYRHYALGSATGPFRTDEECVVLEVSVR